MRSVLLLCAVLLLAVSAAVAQDSAGQRGPDGSAYTFIPGVDVLPTAGIPFSADERVVWTRPVEGGGTITTHLDSKIVRDSQGRVYRERHNFGPATADAAATLTQFYVIDPTTRSVTVCLKAQRVCHIVPYRSPPTRLQPVGSFNGGKEFLSRQTLGTQILQDLQVSGTLESVSIQAGTFGNDQVLTLTREFWYSPDLQINLTVVRKDPRTGMQDVRVSVLSRSDPDPNVFAVPAGYRVEDNRPSAVHVVPPSTP
jgi:hypothetical protein